MNTDIKRSNKPYACRWSDSLAKFCVYERGSADCVAFYDASMKADATLLVSQLNMAFNAGVRAAAKRVAAIPAVIEAVKQAAKEVDPAGEYEVVCGLSCEVIDLMSQEAMRAGGAA